MAEARAQVLEIIPRLMSATYNFWRDVFLQLQSIT